MKSLFIGKKHLFVSQTHLSLNGTCIGYIDPTERRGVYMISLRSDFGEDSELCSGGKKAAMMRLLEIYEKAIA